MYVKLYAQARPGQPALRRHPLICRRSCRWVDLSARVVSRRTSRLTRAHGKGAGLKPCARAQRRCESAAERSPAQGDRGHAARPSPLTLDAGTDPRRSGSPPPGGRSPRSTSPRPHSTSASRQLPLPGLTSLSASSGWKATSGPGPRHPDATSSSAVSMSTWLVSGRDGATARSGRRPPRNAAPGRTPPHRPGDWCPNARSGPGTGLGPRVRRGS